MHPLPSITMASCEVVAETNALAVFNLPPVLLPESVQPLVKRSTNFQGIQWTHNLSCLSIEAPVPKLWPLHSWSVSLFKPWHAQVKYCLVIVQHPNSLTSVSRSCPSFRRCSFCFSPPLKIFSLWCFCFSLFGEGQSNQPPFLCPHVFTVILSCCTCSWTC